MASITIRNLDDETKQKLRLQAAHNARSMEEEAREVLRAALAKPRGDQGSIFDAVRKRFKKLGGMELEPLPRQIMRDPPSLDE